MNIPSHATIFCKIFIVDKILFLQKNVNISGEPCYCWVSCAAVFSFEHAQRWPFTNRDHEGHRDETSIHFSFLGFHSFLSFSCILPRPTYLTELWLFSQHLVVMDLRFWSNVQGWLCIMLKDQRNKRWNSTKLFMVCGLSPSASTMYTIRWQAIYTWISLMHVASQPWFSLWRWAT